MLLVDGKALGIVEAKMKGSSLSQVVEQSARYGNAEQFIPQRWADPLPVTYNPAIPIETFKAVYKPGKVAKRKETDRFKEFTYDEIVARDKANLDILWLKDESLEDTENLPAPAILAAEIVESLETALEEFRGVEDALRAED